ncbi:class I SAM-dependent methyltransferase [Streptomyces fulvoviolaceus]|uniref:class I SAM-dependent methyltransferase n=1 Tax=Streptomyces fulvoviolaceus TaxID=285535 RepID=UPI0004C9DDBC|nr:class I SAM-dependent methyltransferase [Streptomyces fulvoviolaceus]
MTDDILTRARTLSGYDDVSRIRQSQDHDWVLDLVPEPPSTVADLGCGTGALLDAALARWPGVVRAVGIDGNERRVREAGVRLAGRAELLTGDLLRLPPLDDRFDVAFMTSVLHWLHPDEDRAFAWTAAHLAPGGTFVLTTHHPLTDARGFGGEDVVARDALAALGYDDSLAGIVPMGVRARPAQPVRALLARHFTVTAVEERQVPVRAESAERYRDFHASTFGTYFSRLVPPDRQEDFFEAVGRAAARRGAEHGEVYGITVRAWRATPLT